VRDPLHALGNAVVPAVAEHIGRLIVAALDISGWHTPDFREQAACTSADPEAFFPDKGNSAKPAKDLCKRCPAIVECLDWALEHNEQFGVWAGTTPDERKALRRKKAS
jgi:hypothetical protein